MSQNCDTVRYLMTSYHLTNVKIVFKKSTKKFTENVTKSLLKNLMVSDGPTLIPRKFCPFTLTLFKSFDWRGSLLTSKKMWSPSIFFWQLIWTSFWNLCIIALIFDVCRTKHIFNSRSLILDFFCTSAWCR